MADLRSKALPNLKISVDNTESTDESSDEVEIREETEISFHDDDAELSEESGEEEEIDKNEVEFNVRIGSSSFSDPKQKKSKRDRDDDSYPQSKKSDSAKQDIKTTVATTKRLPQIPEKRVYENKQGGFVTGIDVTSKEAEKKRLERAKRFRIQQERDEQFSVDAKDLFDSLGVKKEDFENEEKGLREDAIHLRGTDNMSTKDVFDYFTQFPASQIEWINDTSCNVVWRDKVTGVRALLNLSISYKDAVAAENKKKEEERRKEEQKKKEEEGRKEKQKKEERQRRKQPEIRDEEMKEIKRENQDNAISADAASSGSPPAGQDLPKHSEEEQMEVDDDDLDLMVENEVVDLSKTDAVDPGKDKSKASLPEEESTSTTTSGKDGEKDSEKERTLQEAQVSEKTQRTKDGGSKSKDGKKALKKKDKKEVEKQKKKERQKEKGKDKGEESDSSSSFISSSSSGSSWGSSSGSSSSSWDSDSSSSSGSDSDSSSSSSSDSESEDESKKKKKSSQKSKGDTEDLEEKRQRRKDHTIPWPPGKWRLGLQCKKARYLFMRFATKHDKKEMGAEKKSQYYRKYGNPNYGGMKGLISSSRKRKILFAKLDKEIKSQGPDAREAIDKKRADRQRHRQEEEREEGELSNEELMEREKELEPLSEGEDLEEMEEPMVVEKPKDLRQLLNRDVGSVQSSRRPEKPLEKVMIRKRQQEMDEDSDNELDLDAELEQLMEPRPAKKRMMMRMHADDEEERIKARRSHTGRGLLTVTASGKGSGVQSRLGGRLGGRLQLPAQQRSGAPDISRDRGRRGHVWNNEARVLNSEDDDDDDAEDIEEMDDFTRELESYRSLRNLPPLKSSRFAAASKVTGVKPSLTLDSPSEGGDKDLRARLGAQKQGKDSDKRNFPSMRIEVFDDDDDDDDE